jgi:predicted kinase
LTPKSPGAEVVLVMGLPGAGKSTYAETLAAQGYVRLNRDEAGGTLRDLIPSLDAALASEVPRIVLDNTYVTRKSRAEVVRAAATHGVPVRCVWLKTSVEDAQVNAAWRIAARYGKLPDEAELKVLRKHDVAAMPPSVQFRYQRDLEPPDPSEGFSRIDTIDFDRRADASFINRAVIVWCDGVLLRSRSGARVPLSARRRRGRCRPRGDPPAAGVRRLPRTRPVVASRRSRTARSRMPARLAVFARMRERLGIDIEVEYLPARRRSAGVLVPETAPGRRRPLSSSGTGWIPALHLRRRRSRRMPASRGGWDSSTRTPPTSSSDPAARRAARWPARDRARSAATQLPLTPQARWR